MSQSHKRFLITQSLLSDWPWSYKREGAYDDFLNTLRNVRKPPTGAMLDGIRFENCLNAALDGTEIDITHEWYKPITSLTGELQSAQQQVKASRDVTIDGISFVLYGKLDYLKCGVIYDTKFSKTYHVGKYLDSPQHPMYFALVPEAYEFQYKICDGKYVYTEKYRPHEVEPIERTITQFMQFLDKHGLVDTYCEHWKSKY